MKLIEFFGKDSVYFGSCDNWEVVFDYSRDFELIDKANLEYIKTVYGILGKSDAEFPADIRIERASHWAVGWIEYIIINPDNTEFVAIANNIAKKLADYPILSEDIYLRMQDEYYTECMEDIEREFPADILEQYHDEIQDYFYEHEYVDTYTVKKIIGENK